LKLGISSIFSLGICVWGGGGVVVLLWGIRLSSSATLERTNELRLNIKK